MAEYTITFKKYLDEYAKGEAGYIIPFIDDFPPFSLGNLNYNFKDMFISRNLYKEIGAETPEMFSHYLEQVMRETAVKYVPKINIYIENFNNTVKRIQKLERTETKTYNTMNTNTSKYDHTINDKSYLNPINGDTDKLQSRNENTNITNNLDKNTKTGNDTINKSDDYMLAMFQSNADILKKVMEIENIYMEALYHLDILFMGVI